MQHPANSQLLERLCQATDRLRSSAELPELVMEMERLGITHCHTYLADGSTCYYGPGFFRLEGPAKWSWSPVSDVPDAHMLAHALELHHAGRTDRDMFLRQAADAGVEVFTTHVSDRSITFLDSEGHVMVVEPVVAPAARYN